MVQIDTLHTISDGVKHVLVSNKKNKFRLLWTVHHIFEINHAKNVYISYFYKLKFVIVTVMMAETFCKC